MKTMKAAAAALVLAMAMPAIAREPAPRATALAHEIDEESMLAFVVAEPTADANVRLGVAAVCHKATGETELYFSFGAFPSNKPVQAAVQHPDGFVQRLGPAVRAPGPSAGYHDLIVSDPELVQPVLEVIFTNGSLISNGHNSVWLELPEGINADIRRRIGECAG